MPPVPDPPDNVGGDVREAAHQLTIVVPAYNEAHRLAAGMRRFEAAVSAGAIDLEQTELVVVDDGSTDGTAAEAEKLLAALPHYRVIRLPFNQGKGAAVRAGVAAARSTYTAYMDADMAIDPMAVALLLDGLADHDVAIGCRALPDSMVETSYVVRALMGRLFNELVTMGTGLGLKDTQCGFKAFRTPVARLLFHLVRIDRFAFDVEILARASRLGLSVTEVPVHWKHVEGSTVHPWHDSVAMLADVVRSRRGYLVGPPVPALTVGVVGSDTGAADGLAARVARCLGDQLDGIPLTVVTGRQAATALLPMVDADGVTAAHTALRAQLAPCEVIRTPLTLAGLVALGPFAGPQASGPAPASTG